MFNMLIFSLKFIPSKRVEKGQIQWFDAFLCVVACTNKRRFRETLSPRVIIFE